ncbi:MAG: ABC transporter ATP-binding protein [Planctomycetota bacterium]
MTSNATETVIRCRGLRRSFGNTIALDGVDLEMPPGVCALVGENGSGKTTLMRILACVDSPNQGEAEVLGHSIFRAPAEIRRNIGFVPQHPAFHDWMNVAEVIWFHSAFYESWDVALAERLRERVALDPKRVVSGLTTGMKMRLSMVLALAHRPPLLILDEPLAGLDPSVREDVIELLIEHQGECDASIFISSHQVQELDALVDRVAYLEEGRILFERSRQDLTQSIRRIEILFEGPAPDHVSVPGRLRSKASGQRLLIDVDGYRDELLESLKKPGVRSVEASPLDLEEAFVALAKRGRP